MTVMEIHMTSEDKKRLHRCCFTGQRPEKLNESQAQEKAWIHILLMHAVVNECNGWDLTQMK